MLGLEAGLAEHPHTSGLWPLGGWRLPGLHSFPVPAVRLPNQTFISQRRQYSSLSPFPLLLIGRFLGSLSLQLISLPCGLLPGVCYELQHSDKQVWFPLGQRTVGRNKGGGANQIMELVKLKWGLWTSCLRSEAESFMLPLSESVTCVTSKAKLMFTLSKYHCCSWGNLLGMRLNNVYRTGTGLLHNADMIFVPVLPRTLWSCLASRSGRLLVCMV